MSANIPLKDVIKPLINDIYELKEENGLEIYPIFHLLPPRRDYPDYYKIIEYPLSLSTIKKRLTQYRSAQEFINDLARVTWNARVYNTKESDVYHYALILDRYVRESIVPSLQKTFPEVQYPYLGPLPDEVPLEGVEIVEPEKEQKYAKLRIQEQEAEQETAKKQFRERVNSRVLNPEYTLEHSPRSVRTASADFMSTSMNDADYVEEPKRQLPLTKSRVPQMSPPLINPSKSATPQPMIPKVNPERRTHMKRGRPPVIDLPFEQRIKNVIKSLKKEPMSDGRDFLAAKFERLPDEDREPQYYTVISDPISLDDIRKKVKQRKYKNFQKFQEDVMLMLSNYRMYHRTQPNELRRAGEFEAKFNDFCQYELSRPDEDFMTDGELKYPLETVEWNGKVYKIGDWVLLHNPNDETKPTVGQIFRLWYTSDGTRWLNCCWYLRPEQTVHRVDRLFYKNEVVKSGQYRDHLVEEVVGKCYVCHFTRFQRGDPDLPVEGPLFVCEYRYNESEKVFNKIRTWKGCLPEEVRDIEDPTIPVVGRKFYKYESPIKHLLPPNASINDPLPQPTEGMPNAPPLVGAVYLGPKLRKDDLGEYSTSDDCPRYIIRPGDVPEPGKYDDETGTVVTNQQTTSSLPRVGHPGTRLTSLTRNNSQPSLNNSQPKYNQYFPPTQASRASPGNLPLQLPLQQQVPQQNMINQPPHQLPSQQILNHQPQLQPQPAQQLQGKPPVSNAVSDSVRSIPYKSTAVFSNLLQQTKPPNASPGTVVVDASAAYTLPIPVTKHIELLQRADYASQVRRLGKDNVPRKRKAKGEIIWFRGPSVSISERLINSGDEVPLNRWHKRSKTSEVSDSGDETIQYPSSFPTSLRPSASYIAYKLREQSMD